MKKLALLDGEVVSFHAEDKGVRVINYDNDAVMLLPYTQTSGLPAILKVKINCPVMLTRNYDKKDGLTNGQRGYVTYIDTKKDIIWVKFSDGIGKKAAGIAKRSLPSKEIEGSVPIPREKGSFPCKRVAISRKQFPLVLAYAITTHKAQGQTTNTVIIDYTTTTGREPWICNGQFYVALTRAKKLENVYLKSFDRRMVKTCPTVMNELRRLRKKRNTYCFYKQYLFEDVFTPPIEIEENKELNDDEVGIQDYDSSNEVKITYLNINGLLHAEHIKCIRCDYNILASNILCFTETKLSLDIQNNVLNIDNFDIVFRHDFSELSMGIIIYKKKGTQFQFNVTDSFSDQKCSTC